MNPFIIINIGTLAFCLYRRRQQAIGLRYHLSRQNSEGDL